MSPSASDHVFVVFTPVNLFTDLGEGDVRPLLKQENGGKYRWAFLAQHSKPGGQENLANPNQLLREVLLALRFEAIEYKATDNSKAWEIWYSPDKGPVPAFKGEEYLKNLHELEEVSSPGPPTIKFMPPKEALEAANPFDQVNLHFQPTFDTFSAELRDKSFGFGEAGEEAQPSFDLTLRFKDDLSYKGKKVNIDATGLFAFKITQDGGISDQLIKVNGKTLSPGAQPPRSFLKLNGTPFP